MLDYPTEDDPYYLKWKQKLRTRFYNQQNRINFVENTADALAWQYALVRYYKGWMMNDISEMRKSKNKLKKLSK